MIFFDSQDADWVCLRVCLFHYTLFKTDLLDILDIAGLSIPFWAEILIGEAQKLEARPIPEAPFPQTLPTVQTIRDNIPHVIEPGFAYRLFDGYQVGGLALNPGGEPVRVEIPFKAKLRSWTFLGLNFWLQGGLLNGAGCLVSQALLYYQRVTETPAYYPLLPITGYVEGRLGRGARIYHEANLIANGVFAGEPFYAHNMIHYNGGGNFSVDRSFVVSCPVPEYPTGHFMRPLPGMKMKMSCVRGVMGRYTPLLEDDFIQSDSLETVPFGCLPGWPDDEFLGQFGLFNDDNINLDGLSTIAGLSGECSPYHDAMIAEAGWGKVVVQEELEGEEGAVNYVSVGVLLAATRLFSEKGFLFRNSEFVSPALTVSGIPVTVAGRGIEV